MFVNSFSARKLVPVFALPRFKPSGLFSVSKVKDRAERELFFYRGPWENWGATQKVVWDVTVITLNKQFLNFLFITSVTVVSKRTYAFLKRKQLVWRKEMKTYLNANYGFYRVL